MKNLRIAKKNPSKVLKILDMPPATYRYVSSREPIALTLRTNAIDIKSQSKQHKNLDSNRDSSLRHSPSRSQRVIQVKSNFKNKKVRNRSLGSSHEAIKSQDESSSLLRFRNSHQLKVKQEHSPYNRKPKFRESQKILNFHSVSLNERFRKQDRSSKQKQGLKSVSKKRSTQIKFDHIEDAENQRKALSDNLQSAKRLMSQGEYRKSLLLVRNILQSNPSHLQSLYLSAVNWYHLQDRVKALLFLEQIFMVDAAFSPECYKMAAVCYSKSFEYSRCLACLANCHKHFPKQAESYDIEGKVLTKIRKWEEASQAYQIGYDLSKNPSYLINKAACYEQLNQLILALECYETLLESSVYNFNVAVRKMQLHLKLQQFEQVVQVYHIFTKLRKVSAESQRQQEEFYYMAAYSQYKLRIECPKIDNFSECLVVIDEGVRCSTGNLSKLNKLLLMIRIHERDIYQAFHLVTRMKQDPELRVIMKFIEGVIQLMRRNYEEGIQSLLSIQNDLGFTLQFSIDESKVIQEKGTEVPDQLYNQIRNIYVMFLSYGYYNLSEFRICRKLFFIQQQIGVPSYFQLGFAYNNEMCEGILAHCDKEFKQAELHFRKASKIYDNRLEPPFSLALNCLQIMVNSNKEDERKEMAENARSYFQSCQRIVGKSNTNTAAGVFYFSSLLHGYLQEWKQALDSIDESVERSEDHYWRYFYVRGLLLSCIHSFREAVNDLTLAVALSGITRPQCYLLRSKCLQIEGQGNEAFKDLQQYISLRPDDPQVHKYAGQLLFQNGAFEDALVAFSHQPIAPLLENYDVFLTQGKSMFLLGRFKEAYDIIKQAQGLKYCQEVQLDLAVIDILENICKKLKPYNQIEKDVEAVFAKYPKLGRIFKKSDYHIIKAICHMFQSSFQSAISQFLLAVQQKTQELTQSEGEDESGIFENKKDLSTFTNQMKYNIVLCNLGKGQRHQAIAAYKEIMVDIDQPFYGDYINFKKFISRQSQTYKKDEIFPSRNKLSNFLDKIQVNLQPKNHHQKVNIQLKLCIPFPKVEPPQIFPSFDKSLLARLSVMNVERKPEAPWVLRENNSIKFTDKIETYSKFELEDSQNESSSTYQMISIDQSHIDTSQRSKRLKTSEVNNVQEGGRLSRMDK